MSKMHKNQKDVLIKLNIEKLNPMQEEAILAIHSKPEIILLSPTGTGKTLAFLLPIIHELDVNCTEVQALIIVPSRELAIQIEQVIRQMGTGYKANAVYGGRAGFQDKTDLKHRPAVLVGTPGRIADILRKNGISSEYIQTLVLDEFDKSLEIGFENEMNEIVKLLPNIKKKILTSATNSVDIPEFVRLKSPFYIDYLDERLTQLSVKLILSPTKDKLETLVNTICHLGNQSGIVFCNFKDTIQYVSDYLTENKIPHGCFYGGMEQIDRERALIKFRNGTYPLLIATDLAARGIDVPEIKYIIHYQLPNREHEFVHRNGRTARMKKDGTAYVIKWEKDNIPDFIENPEIEEIKVAPLPATSQWETLYISGGRRDKISKSDIAGLFLKQGKLKPEELGVIEIKQDCSYVSVIAAKVNKSIEATNDTKLKTKKVRVSMI